MKRDTREPDHKWSFVSSLRSLLEAEEKNIDHLADAGFLTGPV
jgi:hypothetical protein